MTSYQKSLLNLLNKDLIHMQFRVATLSTIVQNLRDDEDDVFHLRWTLHDEKKEILSTARNIKELLKELLKDVDKEQEGLQ